MRRAWKNLDELLAALARRAIAGKSATLTPETTALLVNALRSATSSEKSRERLAVDLYSQGSTIYRLDQAGQSEEVVAWGRNALVARAALEELKRRYPGARFIQCRRSWVEWKGVVCGLSMHQFNLDDGGGGESVDHRFTSPAALVEVPPLPHEQQECRPSRNSGQ